MLESLNIRNFALIEDLTIEFRSGLNVLSGETGAGKSIVIGALGMVLGEKSSPNMVRTGEEFASIEGLFDISGNEAASNFLKANSFDISGGDALVRRTISAEGKSRSFINGSLASINLLKELGSLLVDIHGQHEHQSLLRIARHIEMLDMFAGVESDTTAIRKQLAELRNLEKQLDALNMDEKEKQRRLELNAFAIQEIDAAALKENEEHELEEESRVLNNFEKIFSSLDKAYGFLQSSGALGQAKSAASELESVSEHDSNAASLGSRCQDIVFSLEDIVDELRSYKNSIEFSPGRQEEVNARLAMLQSLKRKYGESVSEVLAYREKCFQENQSISSSDMVRAELSTNIEKQRAALSDFVFALSKKRQAKALELEALVMKELAFLGMEKTVFKVDIRYVREESGFVTCNGETIRLFDNGIDYVEFLIAPNPGEEAKSLRKIASGGEMSRVMLAFKAVLTGGSECDTLVFDEVDAGIGGVTASAVGKKLQQVAMRNQVLCITHLPQIAAMGDHQLLVRKSVSEGRTKTEVRYLSHEERLQELSRMIGGEAVSETTLAQAREMIEKSAG